MGDDGADAAPGFQVSLSQLSMLELWLLLKLQKNTKKRPPSPPPSLLLCVCCTCVNSHLTLKDRLWKRITTKGEKKNTYFVLHLTLSCCFFVLMKQCCFTLAAAAAAELHRAALSPVVTRLCYLSQLIKAILPLTWFAVRAS